MFGLFKSDPKKKLQKEIDQLSAKALTFQRNGDLREYGRLMKKIEELEKKKELID